MNFTQRPPTDGEYDEQVKRGSVMLITAIGLILAAIVVLTVAVSSGLVTP